MNEHVYYADGGRMWTNFVAQPVNPVPTERHGASPLTSPESDRRIGRSTTRDPLEEFYDLDSE